MIWCYYSSIDDLIKTLLRALWTKGIESLNSYECCEPINELHNLRQAQLGPKQLWGTNKIQEAERQRKWNIHIGFDLNFDFTHPKYQNNLVIWPQKGKLT